MTEIVLPRTTREFIEVPVTVDGTPVTTFTVAVLPEGRDPGDTDWQNPTEVDGKRGVLIGPDDGGRYTVWTRVQDTPETVVRQAGTVVLSPGDDEVVPLALVEGQYFAAEVYVPRGAELWPSEAAGGSGRVLYAEVRRGPGYPVLLDLAPYLEQREDGDDLYVRIRLTGAQTRVIADKLDGADAQYDAFIGSPGTDQARALRIIQPSPVTIQRSLTGAPPVTP